MDTAENKEYLLTEEQEDVLFIFAESNNNVSLEDDDNIEWIYEVALNSFSYTESVVDTIVEELKLHGYIDNNKQITARGTDYLKHHTAKDRKERTGANKRQILDSKIKIVSGVLALIATAVTLVLTIYNALK